jgi:hypothetical protein
VILIYELRYVELQGRNSEGFVGDSVSVVADMLRDVINNTCYLFSIVIL